MAGLFFCTLIMYSKLFILIERLSDYESNRK